MFWSSCLRRRSVGPDQLHQLTFSTARPPDVTNTQQIERFGRDRDESISSPQFARAAVQSKQTELVALIRPRCRTAADQRFQNFHGNFRLS